MTISPRVAQLIAIIFILFNSISSNFVEAAPSGLNSWAVLLEMNEFPEGWTDLNVDFINTQRMREALRNLGWRDDHMYIVNGNITITVLQDAIEWLKNKADASSTVLLYIFTHGVWIRDVLLWNTWFPDEWQKIIASKKILAIDTCFAEEFLEPMKNDPSPHIHLGCCSTGEVSWAGLEEEGLPIIGSVWNYYLTNALCNSSADYDNNGLISVEEAFNFSAPLVQQYMNRTVFTVSEFLESYHRISIYPELLNAYPHPTMDDNYSNQMIIPEFPSLVNLKLLILTTLIIILLKRTRTI